MTHKPFTQMLAELNIYLGNRKIMPQDTNDIADMTDDGKDNEFQGGAELPPERSPEEAESMVSDLDDETSDLSELSIDQIINALVAIKAKMDNGGFQDLDSDDMDGESNPMSHFGDDADGTAFDDDTDGVDLDKLDEPSPEDDSFGMDYSPGTDSDSDQTDPFADFGSDDEDDLDSKKNSLDDLNFPDASGNSSEDGESDSDLGDTDELGNAEDPSADAANAIDGGATAEPDHNRMGTIRTIKGAHLVYKRQNGDGTFSELWIYNIGEHINDSITVKKAIVAGTDIPEDKLRSEDGSQSYELTTLGNAQMLKINGLPN